MLISKSVLGLKENNKSLERFKKICVILRLYLHDGWQARPTPCINIAICWYGDGRAYPISEYSSRVRLLYN